MDEGTGIGGGWIDVMFFEADGVTPAAILADPITTPEPGTFGLLALAGCLLAVINGVRTRSA